jgi:DNA (cytosine-5)-methyltransferase 1
VLDAQYFGVAQRRRRVFVVASARNDVDPAAVLFERESLRRDTTPSREAGKVAPTIPSRSTAGGGLGTDFDLDGGVIAGQVGPTLRAGGNSTGGDRPPGTDVDTADSLIAMCLNAGGMGRLDAESETLLPISIQDVTYMTGVQQQMAVRRLTPVECERLQGFPDGHTNIPWRNKPESPDGPRYKALGNSWAVPVVRWIGERIHRAIA